jgi:hypothetical protein
MILAFYDFSGKILCIKTPAPTTIRPKISYIVTIFLSFIPTASPIDPYAHINARIVMGTIHEYTYWASLVNL